MRTAEQCRDKALHMERQAGLCVESIMKAEYVDLARRWRDMAEQATWQDAFECIDSLS